MDANQLLEVLPLLTIVGSAGAAWGGALYAITGTKERLTKHEAYDALVHKEMRDHAANMIDRQARTETKIDMILERLKDRR